MRGSCMLIWPVTGSMMTVVGGEQEVGQLLLELVDVFEVGDTCDVLFFVCVDFALVHAVISRKVSLHPPSPSWRPPNYDGMTQREIHANEGQYIACVSKFKNINQLEQQLTNLLIYAYDR